MNESILFYWHVSSVAHVPRSSAFWNDWLQPNATTTDIKKQKTNQIYNKLKVSNVSVEFTSHKDLTAVLKKQNHFWMRRRKKRENCMRLNATCSCRSRNMSINKTRLKYQDCSTANKVSLFLFDSIFCSLVQRISALSWPQQIVWWLIRSVIVHIFAEESKQDKTKEEHKKKSQRGRQRHACSSIPKSFLLA